jgi:hypothetical protein
MKLVLEKRGLRPHNKVRMSCECSIGWMMSQRATALVFRHWQYAEMVESPCTMEWDTLRIKMANNSLLARKISSIAT